MSDTPRVTGRGARQRAELHFGGVRVRAAGVEFEATDASGEKIRFAISRETLLEITDSPEGTALAEMFESQRERIHGVAARAFSAGARGAPIRLPAAMFPLF
ncbi:MAG TPA: DUF1488 family protein [Burkholderiaceae bacterium]|nr:DUF1488 family protein [Burkholderiaceae bacterium]